jgi:hypothetical protein
LFPQSSPSALPRRVDAHLREEQVLWRVFEVEMVLAIG